MESSRLTPGQHDINKPLELPKQPGLLIHDSMGVEAGSDEALQAMRRFVRLRAKVKEPKERLHAIWSVFSSPFNVQNGRSRHNRICIDSGTSRIEKADISIFEMLAKYCADVPLFVVGTKRDNVEKLHNPSPKEIIQHARNPIKIGEIEANCRRETQEQLDTLVKGLENIQYYKSNGTFFVSYGTSYSFLSPPSSRTHDSLS